ncbi:hypothetical protein M758_10G055100 [Ceratodon purpureus]|uniref:Uncharacterized protein n=1 Tax=Ceratodon purpureus TaxID=3225 RepID=A0A8T0GIM7_CERPU|nr:hypothetical protein KC19_10G058800 [Ceratodon purpureus]KAG0602971.1 hypothetical protein M758_10G055100 [Ceratodon purpureus]
MKPNTQTKVIYTLFTLLLSALNDEEKASDPKYRSHLNIHIRKKMRTELQLPNVRKAGDVTDTVEEACETAQDSRRRIVHVRNRIKKMQFPNSNF